MNDKDDVCIIKSQADLDAYCRAMDAANDAIVEQAEKRAAEEDNKTRS